MAGPTRPVKADSTPLAEVYRCWVCDTVMREIKCKLICPHCGLTRDCSDP